MTMQVERPHCNSGIRLHQTWNPSGNQCTQVPSVTASAQEEGIEIHRWKVPEKQEVEGKYPDKGIRKSRSAPIGSCIISLSYIRIK